jgi:cyclic pyranopterin phosphate synthase
MDEQRDGPTHLDAEGVPRMVDVSEKDGTRRTAVAEGRIRMSGDTVAVLSGGRTAKGDVLQVARLAGIQAGKRTGELIPLCHILPGASIQVDVELDADLPGVRARAKAVYTGQTGVEMEALTAVSVALLTVYDMLKSLDRTMVLEGIGLVSKEGGRSGAWVRDGTDGQPRGR